MKSKKFSIDRYNSILRHMIYAFIYFLLFDGVIRKWIMPSYSTPVMMIKQVLAVLICFYGANYLLKLSKWEKSFAIAGFIVFFSTLLFGHQNIIVDIYGCLPYWFGLPLCFIIGHVLNCNDLLRIGRLITYASIFNSLLLIVQFCSPIESFINRQGLEIDTNLVGYTVSNLNGGFRPSGIFIYNTQNSLFMLLSLSFILFLLTVVKNGRYRYILIGAISLNILSLPFTISRTTIFYEMGLLFYFLFVCVNRRRWFSLLKLSPVIIIVFFIVSFIPIVQVAMETIINRFVIASSVLSRGSTTAQGTLMDIINRGIIYNINALFDPKTLDGQSVPFWGFGQGMSTQVGGRLLGLNKHSGFALAEWDGLRIVCESGLFLGWIIIFIRLGYAFRFLLALPSFLRKHKQLSVLLLPVFLVSFYLLNTWGNLFQANFAFLVGGLFLASIKYRFSDKSASIV